LKELLVTVATAAVSVLWYEAVKFINRLKNRTAKS
jgi:hypothetical protein